MTEILADIEHAPSRQKNTQVFWINLTTAKDLLPLMFITCNIVNKMFERWILCSWITNAVWSGKQKCVGTN